MEQVIRSFTALALAGHPLQEQAEQLERSVSSLVDSACRAFGVGLDDDCVELRSLSLRTATEDPSHEVDVSYRRADSAGPRHDDDHGHEHVCFEICLPIPWPDWPPYAWLCAEICLPAPEGVFVPRWTSPAGSAG